MKTLLDTMEEAIRTGGETLLHYFGKSFLTHEKGPGDLVTEADSASEKKIIEIIKGSFPHHAILSEEAGLSKESNENSLWIVDPLDGTTNFVHSYPFIAVTIAFKEKGKLLCGMTFDPLRDELFKAVEGRAFLNDRLLLCSKTQTLEKALLATGFAYDRRQNPATNYPEFCRLTHQTQGVRRSGSAALDLAYVAAGRLDGFWERGLKPWDMAVGALLVEAALGRVSTYDDSAFYLESDSIVATNGPLHDELIEVLKTVRQRPAFPGIEGPRPQ